MKRFFNARTPQVGLLTLGFATAGCQVFQSKPLSRGTGLEIFHLEKEDARIVTNAWINGHSARLLLDTGCEGGLLLFAQHTKKLGVAWTKPSELDASLDTGPGRMVVYGADLKTLDCFGMIDRHVGVGVYEIPDRLVVAKAHDEPEGVIGWPVVRSQIIIFALQENLMGPIDEVPKETQNWTTFSVADKNTLKLHFTEEETSDLSSSVDPAKSAEALDHLLDLRETSSLQSPNGWIPRKIGTEYLSFEAELGDFDFRPSLVGRSGPVLGAPSFKMMTWKITEDPDGPIPNFQRVERRLPTIVVDTGADCGVLLPRERWREWKAGHPHAPVTIETNWMAGQEEAAVEISLADEIQFGDLVFRNITVREADPAYFRDPDSDGNIVVLGIEALNQMQLVIDYPHRIAYAITPSATAPDVPDHNRVGLALTLATPEGRELVAPVLPGTPAAESDVRNGDILLKVDGHDLTHWPEHPEQLDAVKLTQPAGSKISFTIKRGTEILERSMTTRDLLRSKTDADADLDRRGRELKKEILEISDEITRLHQKLLKLREGSADPAAALLP